MGVANICAPCPLKADNDARQESWCCDGKIPAVISCVAVVLRGCCGADARAARWCCGEWESCGALLDEANRCCDCCTSRVGEAAAEILSSEFASLRDNAVSRVGFAFDDILNECSSSVTFEF